MSEALLAKEATGETLFIKKPLGNSLQRNIGIFVQMHIVTPILGQLIDYSMI